MQNLLSLAHQATQHLTDKALSQLFQQPIFILSAPRSGSTLLFEQLIQQDHMWSIGNESHVVFSQFPHLRFANGEQDSSSLNATHADARTNRLIKACFLFMLQNKQNQRYIDPKLTGLPKAPIFIEKTPRNALNIPFILKIFPDARFIYLQRDPRQTIASLIEAWHLGIKTGRFATYPNLPGWHLPAWCFLLPAGWRQMIGKSIAEIACFQWQQSNQTIEYELAKLDPNRTHRLDYYDLINNSHTTLCKVIKFINPNHDISTLSFKLTPSNTTLTRPDPEKWRKYEDEIMALKSIWGKKSRET
ncbi:sulfotransferase family protein [Marinicella litoralis]|uniref:Sulfotransferase family protein n=1 Tax=Marinicella litoralis TaxID=644220 RepID=A0A4R6XAW1_9GAMM|nr:sulfotransferase [Marinicella litoralis]TDR16322.1 sulfotransferase family protein [Marinicella litoralis]